MIEHVNFDGGINHKVLLRQLADSDDLKGCVVICLWEDGTMTNGWSKMNTGQVALASLALQRNILIKGEVRND